MKNLSGSRLVRISRGSRVIMAALILAGLFLALIEVNPTQTAYAATFDVSNTNDSGAGSLRQAILDVNAAAGGSHTINFSVSGNAVITLTTPLPALTAGNVTIGSRGGSASDTCQTSGSIATPRVTINAAGAGAGAVGLAINSNGNTIQGLVIIGATGAGITIAGDNNTLLCNYIGVDQSGTAGPNGIGIEISSGTGNTIGGNNNGDGNNVSSNTGLGLVISGTVASTQVVNNTFSKNGAQGVVLTGTGTNNRLKQNSIYGNTGLGIDVGGNNAPDASPVGATATPVVDSAIWDGVKLKVKGSAPANSTVELFLVEDPEDATTYGEGRYYLATVTANGSGNYNAEFNLPAGVPTPSTANKITATATGMAATTSEFSKNEKVTLAPFTLVKVGTLNPGGKTITWLIVASNNTTNTISSVTLSDTATPVLQLVTGTVATDFSSSDPTNSISVGTFPSGTLTFTLAAKTVLAIKYEVKVPAPGGEDEASFGNYVTASSADVNDGQPFKSNVAEIFIRYKDDDGSKSDVVVRCKITPDREASDDEGNEISLKCKLKNIGQGKAKKGKLVIPLDIHLILGYAQFSDPRIWVSEIILIGDKPCIVISFPDMDSNDGEVEAVIVFRPNRGMGNLRGTKVFLRTEIGWDVRGVPGKKNKSNGVFFIFGAVNVNVSGGDTIPFDQPNVVIELGKKVEISSELFEPDEFVDFWLTDSNDVSIAFPRGRANGEGKLLFLFDATGLTTGVFVFVGRGHRTQIQIVCIITIVVIGGGGTPTPTATATISPSPTVTATTTPTVTVTVSPTPTSTVTVSPTPTDTLQSSSVKAYVTPAVSSNSTDKK